MTVETKRARRRRNLLEDRWFKIYGDFSRPKSRTRNWRKHMKLVSPNDSHA